MRYFYVFFCVILSCLTQTTFASSHSGYLIELETKLGGGSENTLSYFLIGFYDINNLEDDINLKIDIKNPAENSIVTNSKTKGWKTQYFTQFINYLETGRINKATSHFRKYGNIISPFLPTCCGFKVYLSSTKYKNGILSLAMGGNDGEEYSLVFTFYKNGILYEISQDTKLHSYVNDTGDQLLVEQIEGKAFLESIVLDKQRPKSPYGDDFHRNMVKKWFYAPGKNKNFQISYNSFLKSIDTISE